MKPLATFPLFYLKEVVVGALLVARDVLLPGDRLAPALLHVPLEGLTPGQRLLFACLVSMTPGTVAVGEEPGGAGMLVHSLYGANSPGEITTHLERHYVPFVSLIPV